MGVKLPTNLHDGQHATPLNRLRHDQCRWILSEHPQKALFCGAPVERGSWCGEHSRIVYAPRRDDHSSTRIQDDVAR
jgi:hypothetical protein